MLGSSWANLLIPDAAMLTVDANATFRFNNTFGNNVTETLDGLAGAGTFDRAGAGASSTLTIYANNSANDGKRSFSGSLANWASLTLSGPGTQEFVGANLNFTNDTALNNGTLKLTNTSAWGSNVTFGSSNTPKLQLNAPSGGDSWTFSKQINGTNAGATIEKTGLGTVILSPAASSTFSGNPLLVSAGKLYLNSGGFTTPQAVTVSTGATFGGTGTAGNITVNNGGSLEGGYAGSGTLTAANVTLGAGSSDLSTILGTLSTTVGYKPIAVTNLTINGGDQSVSLNAGGVGLVSGTYYDLIVSSNVISATNASSVLAALKGTSRAYTPTVDGSGKKIQLYYDAGASVYWTGAASSAWNTSATNWKISSNNADTQFMTNDVVIFNDSPTSATVDISGGNVATVSTTFNNSATNYTLQGSNGISAGSITKNGTGALTITNVNTTTGAVALNGGVVNMSQIGGLGTGAVTFGGGALNFTGTSNATWAPAGVTLNSAATLGVTNAATTLTYTGSLAGSGALTKSGAGTLVLGGTSASYTGAVTVAAGTLNLTTVGALPATTAFTLGANGSTGATLALTPALTVGSLTTAANSSGNTLQFNQTGTASYHVTGLTTLNSALTLVKTSNGGAWADMNFDGGITGGAGAGNDSLIISNLGGSQFYVEGVAGKTYDYTGNIRFMNGNAANYVFQNGSVLSSKANVVLDAGATIIHNTAGTFSFDALNDGSGTGTRSWNANGQSVTLSLGNNNGSGSSSAVISGSATLIKNGTGTQTFTGANSYTGGTTINAGILAAGNASALGSGAVSLAGGSLTTSVGNVGTVNGFTMNNATSQLTMNGANAGTITLTLNANLALTAGTWNIDLANGTDKFVGSGTGAFTLTTGFVLDLGGGGINYGDTYTLLTGFASGSGASGADIRNYDTANWSAALSDAGVLTFTAVPEPSTYGLIGAGALAGVAFIRRRRRV